MKKVVLGAMGLSALALGGAAFAQTELSHGAPPADDAPRLTAVEIAAWEGPNATVGFVPTYLTSPAGDPRLFVVEKRGRIWIIEDGEVLPEPFLDIADLVSPTSQNINNEQGMHGIAFHPDYAENGKFYVFHTATGDVARFVREYTVSEGDPNRADLESGRVLIEFPPPGNIHNGGSLAFGPDGYLYITTGDGGQGGVPARSERARDPHQLYGKLLRIDVNTSSDDLPYGIPEGNMYAEGEGVPEAFAIGLRNWFGLSFDGDWLFAGDIGENSWEEINALNITNGAGTDFGWGIAEGAGCTVPGGGINTPNPRTAENQTCDLEGLTPPVFEYVGQGRPYPCAAIGGATYRGEAIPELDGHYFFGDYCTGLIRSFVLEDGVATQVTDWTQTIAPGYRFGLGGVTGFGVDSEGELYVLTTTYVHAQNSPNPSVGRVWKIVQASDDVEGPSHVEWVGENPPPPLLDPPWAREAPPAAQ